MTLDEISKKVTPEGMYVYLERCEDEPGYRFHVHTGKKWKAGILDYGAIVKDRLEETKSIIYAATHWVDSLGDNELPRRCAAQREVSRSILGRLIGEDGYLKEFSKRMGVNPEAYTWEINPSGQIKSVQVLQNIVNEEIEKLKVPASVVKSGFTIGAEIAEERAREASRQPIKLEESPQEVIDRGIKYEWTPPVKCECGSSKLGIPHSLWCPAL